MENARSLGTELHNALKIRIQRGTKYLKESVAIRLGNKPSRAKLEVSLARPSQADVRLGKAWGSPSRAGP